MKPRISATKPEAWVPVHQPNPSWDYEPGQTCALVGVHGARVPWPCPAAEPVGEAT